MERELRKRIKENPLKYYWPHSGNCDGEHCLKNHQHFDLPDGTSYDIEGCPQFAFHTSDRLTRAIFGGNRSGKTTSGAVEVAMHATGEYPDWYPEDRRYRRPVKGRIFGADYSKGVGEVIIPAINDWFPEGSIKHFDRNNQGVPVKYYVRHKSGGTSVFDILSYEQDSKVCEGWNGDFVWYDEPPPRSHRVATLRGLTDRLGWEIFTLTPLDQPWLYDEIWDKNNPNIETFLMDIRHNIHRMNPLSGRYIGLTPEAIERFEDSLTDEEKQVRRHGKFTHLAGRIWKVWERKIHTFNRKTLWDPKTNGKVLVAGEPPRDWQRVFLIDPHDRKPCAGLWVAKDPMYGTLYVWREMWQAGTFEDSVAFIRDKEMEARDKIDYRIMDPNFGPKRQGNTGKDVRTTFEEAGRALNYPIRFIYGDDHKALGRKMVEKLLFWDKDQPMSIINRPGLFVADDCVNAIYMIEHYIWDDYKNANMDKDVKEEPKDLNTDFPDLLHYLALFTWRDKPAELSRGWGNAYA